MTSIRHMSINVKEPKKAADLLAELTKGTVRPFHPLKGSYVCLWPDWEGSFIEFYPKNAVIVPTDHGGDFETIENSSEFSPVHINLNTELTGDEVINIANHHQVKHHFRPRSGGPLHEVWIENSFMVELVTSDLTP